MQAEQRLRFGGIARIGAVMAKHIMALITTNKMNSRSIIGKLLSIATLGVILSGCVVTPLAPISPAISGFNTTAIIKSGVTAGTNHLVEKRTGKTITDIFEQNLNSNVNSI